MSDTVLEVKGIVKHFAGLVALNGVDFAIRQGDLLGLIGPNGAGKSVLVNCITGLYPPTEGTVLYQKEDITGLRPDRIVKKHISRTFQQSTLFFDLTVVDNIAMGVQTTSEVGLWEGIFHTGSNRQKEKQIQEQAEKIIGLLKLERHVHEVARNLPYGLQKIVAIGIALAGNPELLILDEPLTGLIAAEAEEVMARIDGLHKQGLTVMIIEHNMRAVMAHCTRIVVLSFGTKIAEGTPEEIRKNRDVIKSYLGGILMALLRLENIVVQYGVAVALQGIFLEVEKKDRVALLGANGAGKSTIVNAISGIEPLASGKIYFADEAISGLPPHRIVEMGIAQIPEGRLVFPRMTVWENIELGGTSVRDKDRKKDLREQVFTLFPRLKERLQQPAGTMSGGEQQMLAFGRALMSNPKLILSDEVSMGLAPLVVRELYNTLLRINAEWGVTLLMVEQDAKLALSVARHAYVLETGKIVATGLSEELAQNDVVRKVYLGEE